MFNVADRGLTEGNRFADLGERTFDEDDVYNQADAEGFIKLYGLPMKVAAMLDLEGPGVSEYDSPDFSDFKRD